MHWRLAGWIGFLSDRQGLWEVDTICRRYSVGSPSQYIGFDRIFSDNICYDVDAVVAHFGIQTENRMQEQRKKSSGKWELKYKTMPEVLGIREDEWRGGFDQQELVAAGAEYRQAVVEAAKRGEEVPDIDEWMAQRELAESSDDDD